MNDYKLSTHEKLMNYYDAHDLNKAIKVGRAMLESTSYKGETTFIAHVHGEIAETILECIIMDYIRKYNLQKYGWFYKKGLILKDINHADSGYYTELDLTVFTPQKIFAFECKSYGGNKQLKPFRIVNPQNAKYAPYQLVLFDFATGVTTDERLPQNKILMPCLNETNVSNIFKLNYDKPIMWDIKRVQKAVEIIASHTKQNTTKHLNYVKNLHSNKEQ